MNNWNPWESRLRSWTPRHPSTTLKRKIFLARSESQERTANDWVGPWRWLAPALGCLLVVASIFNPREGEMTGLAGNATNNLLAAWASNQSYTAYFMAGFHSRQNTLGDTLEWTNAQGSFSSVASFSAFKSNRPMR